MTVHVGESGQIELLGTCGSDDAEPLLAELIADPAAVVDWRACEHVHTAVVQVILASRVGLLGPPAGPMLRDFVEPMLARR